MDQRPTLPRGPVRPPRKQPFKSPGMAALFAALSPGSGQMWVGHWQRALLSVALSFLCCVGYFWGIYDAYDLAVKANRGQTHSSDDYVAHAFVTLPLIVAAVFTAILVAAAWAYWGYLQAYIERLLLITVI